jgi:gliding motility-associated-like protein
MVMNTWSGAVLHFLYDFSNTSVQPALYNHLSAFSTLGFNLNVKVTRNGAPVPFTLIAADAEASNQDEITTFTSNGSSWQIVDFFRNSSQTNNPVTGCNTNTVMLTETYGNAAATGQNPVLASAATTGDISVSTLMDHHATGGMAVAFGIMAPVDRGDLPASYGNVYHGLTYSILNGCNYLPPLPSAPKSQTLKLGAVSGDADGAQTLDDNASGIDEDALTTFPAYYNNGTYSLALPLNNTTGSDAYLTGWFDYNRNGVFDIGESVTVTVPDNSSSATLTWSGLPTWLPQGAVTDYGVRLRLSSDITATQNATGFAKDGEVEDYIIPAATLCNISIQTVNDTAVCSGEPVILTTTNVNVISYSWNPSAFLNDATIASPVSNPTSNTTYTVTGNNPQGCIAKDMVTLTIKAPPVVTINNDTTICRGTAVQLSASATGALSYTWLPQTGLNNNTIANPLAQPIVASTYVVTTTNSNGCIGTGSVKISLYPPPNFAVSPVNPGICINDQVQLTASGGDDYSWLDASNTPLGNTASITVQPVSSQTYQVIIKENTCNNSATRSIPVTVNTLPVPVVSKTNDVDCHLVTATLHASGGSTYAWDATPDLSFLNSSDPTATPQQTTTYNVRVISSAGCSARTSITVNVDKRNPVITINNDTTICRGTAVQLTANATGTAVSYAWLPQTGLNNSSIATPIAQPTVATTYVVKATNGDNWCFGEDSVKIAFRAPPVFVVNPSKATLCEKESVLLTASGGDDYTWLDAGNTVLGSAAAISVQPFSSQTYQVIIKENTCNISDTRSIPVTVNSLPVPSITKSNDIDCSTGQAVLRAMGGISYEWDAAPGIGNIISPNPVVTPSQTTTYFVTITNNKGCSARDSVTVVADFAKAMSTYPVPSAFTPNNDGRNDCFGLKLWGQVTQLQFQVFNRWGQRVFATTDPTHCWDGTFKGEPLPAGGYAYTIKAVTRCGSVNRTGMVILIR